MTKVQRVLWGMTNCYLIEGEAGSVLVDTGSGGGQAALAERLRDKNVKLILLTHGHYDHVGGAAYLARALAAPVGLHPADAPLVENSQARPLYTRGALGRLLKAGSAQVERRRPAAPFAADVALADGMRLDGYGVDAEVVALPGHTAGSVGVLVAGRLLAGDAMMHLGAGVVPCLYEDEAQLRASVQKIRRLPAAMVYVGHGRPVRNSGG